jgi:hypothetical protein
VGRERIAMTVAWGFLLIFGLPGLVLAWLNDPRDLPIALTVVIGGTVIATALTVLTRRRSDGCR